MARQNGHCVLLSGGVDSAVMLAQLLEREDAKNVWAVFFDYEQPARRETLASQAIAEHYGVTWCGSSFSAISSGHWGFHEWTDMSKPEQVVLRNRNAMFLSIASVYGGTLWIGATKSDQEVFEDCRRPFFDTMEKALGVNIETPLIGMTKREVVDEARRLDVPMDLCISCYKGTGCGRCLACQERMAAE